MGIGWLWGTGLCGMRRRRDGGFTLGSGGYEGREEEEEDDGEEWGRLEQIGSWNERLLKSELGVLFM